MMFELMLFLVFLFDILCDSVMFFSLVKVDVICGYDVVVLSVVMVLMGM